jgi:hypothetical protein
MYCPKRVQQRTQTSSTNVIVLVDDSNIRVLNKSTATLIRKLALDPTRDYQPRAVKCGNSPENRLQM